MNDMLRTICDATRTRVAVGKSQTNFDAFDRQVSDQGPVRPFLKTMRMSAMRDQAAFITEIKKASPSAGDIRQDFDAAALAKAYAYGGAACLSVLTEPDWFKGSAGDLIAARAVCALPVLRKDFMVDVWQVAEARAMGADCILIIMAAVDDALARDLYQAASDYGMDALVETHDRKELDRALTLPGALIGINNRNLKDLRIDLDAGAELIRHLPSNRFAVSESGIRTSADIVRMREAGAQGFLVGETLLRQKDVGIALRALQA